MPLTDYRTFGRSGLVVSPVALGAMTFGKPGWGSDEVTSRAVWDAYRAAGGNFVDTANVYGGGASEEMVGRFVRDTRARDEMVIATKSGFHHGTGPNTGGNGAKNVRAQLNASLKRLGTDYVDLLWMHVWDGVTPVEEMLSTLGDLVAAGKVRYFGLADMPAWVAIKAATIAALRGVPGPIAVQMEYSLVARGIERQLIAGAVDGGMAVQPWSPLAGGFLSGKYERGHTDGKGRLSGDNPFGASKFTDRNHAILDALREVADGAGCTPAQAAIAWVLSRPGVVAPILGASRPDQLEATIAAVDIDLGADGLAKLTEASALDPEFGDVDMLATIGGAIFGPNPVRGWNA